jgi:hypothetical protein
MDTPTPTPQEAQELIAKVKALPAAGASGHHTLRAAAAALSAYQQEVERLTKERDDWKLATDQFQGMWSDAEARAAVAKRAAFAEAAQMAEAAAVSYQQSYGPCRWDTEESKALDAFAAELLAKAATSIHTEESTLARVRALEQESARLRVALEACADPDAFHGCICSECVATFAQARAALAAQAVPPGATEDK